MLWLSMISTACVHHFQMLVDYNFYMPVDLFIMSHASSFVIDVASFYSSFVENNTLASDEVLLLRLKLRRRQSNVVSINADNAADNIARPGS